MTRSPLRLIDICTGVPRNNRRSARARNQRPDLLSAALELAQQTGLPDDFIKRSRRQTSGCIEGVVYIAKFGHFDATESCPRDQSQDK